MSRRKVFVKTDLSTPRVEHLRDDAGIATIRADAIPPASTKIIFDRNPIGVASHDFGPNYGVGVDAITYACQRQVERFIDKQDGDLELSTVAGYCNTGLRHFLEYLALRSSAFGREMVLADIDRDLIDGYLSFLRGTGNAVIAQKSTYDKTKTVLKALARRGLIAEKLHGDDATFPTNPFPRSSRTVKGESPLPKSQRQAVAAALRASIPPLFEPGVKVTGTLLATAYLYIALSTGRNTVPLLEMGVDCLRPHPRDNTLFLVLYKRRGHRSNSVALREGYSGVQQLESLSTVRPTVVGVIKRAIELSNQLRLDAPEDLKERVWLYRAVAGIGGGKVCALTQDNIGAAIRLLVTEHKLVDSDGMPLKLNVSRLRKTFVNRIYEILQGDVVSTAIAAGNTPDVMMTSYLRPGEKSQKNWKFMGLALVSELLTNTIGSTELTPVGKCSDSKNGEFAPKRANEPCMSFLNCLRCRNYVVTGDDLYKLFSFYWRILKERVRMDKRRWEQQFAHIVRLIDRDVAEAGIAKGIFKPAQVEAARQKARVNPHPFWSSESVISEMEAMA